DLGVRLIHGQQRMAGVAILRDLLPALRFVIAVVASEAARKIVVPEVVGIGSPCNVHLGENIAFVNIENRLCGVFNLGALGIVQVKVILAIVFAQRVGQLSLCRQP